MADPLNSDCKLLLPVYWPEPWSRRRVSGRVSRAGTGASLARWPQDLISGATASRCRSRALEAVWLILLLAVLSLAPTSAALGGSPSTAPAYDFDYRLSGDRRVAPLQIFDDGRHTWLQFNPGQSLPAVFVGPAQDSLRVASYTQQGPYLVIDGTANHLEMRIADVAARAEYLGQVPRMGLAAATDASRPHDRMAANLAPPTSIEPVATVEVRAVANPVDQADRASLMPAAASPGLALEFDAAVADRNMRSVLQRWAREAGWVFGPEHWAVDVDIPLVGSASFGSDFRAAVRGLLAATELAERPLQPCFYSNRVVRVIALTQACDRTVAPAGQAIGN